MKTVKPPAKVQIPQEEMEETEEEEEETAGGCGGLRSCASRGSRFPWSLSSIRSSLPDRVVPSSSPSPGCEEAAEGKQAQSRKGR